MLSNQLEVPPLLLVANAAPTPTAFTKDCGQSGPAKSLALFSSATTWISSVMEVRVPLFVMNSEHAIH